MEVANVTDHDSLAILHPEITGRAHGQAQEYVTSAGAGSEPSGFIIINIENSAE